MKSYFAYTRVSTVKQGERGSSLQEQKAAIEAYARRHGLRILRWFEEMETAAKEGRHTFNRMLGELETGVAVGVVIHKIDRSARNLKDWAHLGELIDRGVEVHFAHESLDLNSRGGRLSADIQAVVAADFIRNLRQEVRKGFYGRLKQGFYPLPAPMGYLDHGKAKAKTFDPDRAPLVRQMFELYASGRYTLDGLREEMHRRGLSGVRGSPLSKNAIAGVLHNPFYIGIMRIARTGEAFPGVHEPLISKAVFDRVQACLSGRAYAHVLKHGFVFRRLIKCARCGHSLTGERQKGHVYYRCHTPACRGTSIREEVVDKEMRGLLKLIAFDEEEMKTLAALAVEARELEVNLAMETQAQCKRALGLCEDRLSRLTDAFVDGDLDRETFNTRKAALLGERSTLNEQLMREDEDSAVDRILNKFELGNMAQLRFDSPDPSEKRETVEFLTSNLIADRKELVIAPRFPFDEVRKWRKSEKGGPCWDGLRTRKEIESLMRTLRERPLLLAFRRYHSP